MYGQFSRSDDGYSQCLTQLLLQQGTTQPQPAPQDNFDTAVFNSSGTDDDETTLDNPFANPEHRQPPRRDREHLPFKIDLPQVQGTMDADVFLDWLASVEEVLTYADIPRNRRTQLVVTRLRGRATDGGSISNHRD